MLRSSLKLFEVLCNFLNLFSETENEVLNKFVFKNFKSTILIAKCNQFSTKLTFQCSLSVIIFTFSLTLYGNLKYTFFPRLWLLLMIKRINLINAKHLSVKKIERCLTMIRLNSSIKNVKNEVMKKNFRTKC